MDLDTLNAWLSLIANVAVIAGIAFLAIEVSQNTLQTKLQTSSSFQDTFTSVELNIASSNELLEALVRSQKGEELTEVDRLRVLVFYRAVLRGYQSSYYQSLAGIIDKEIWAGEKNQMIQSFGFDKGMADYWQQNKSLYTTEFNSLIESFLG